MKKPLKRGQNRIELQSGEVIPMDQASPEQLRELANKAKVVVAEMTTGKRYTIEKVG